MHRRTRKRHARIGAAGRAQLIVLAGLLILAGAASAAPVMTDQAITDQVETELVLDQGGHYSQVDVSTLDGIVTMSGAVDNILARDRAPRLARTVKGVRGVVNRIEVSIPNPREDSEIEDDVRLALLEDPAAELLEIEVAAEDGKVTLSGTVDSWQERELAGLVAKGIRGVRDLDNQLTVEYDFERSDNEIQRDVAERLRWDTLVDDGLIDVEVVLGAVRLSGTVGSAAEKHRAALDGWVAGTMSVDASDLEVERWARDEDLRKGKYVDLADGDVRQAVLDALAYDPRVASLGVIVEVSAGRVTLRGTVHNLKAKRAAAQDARNTVGVNGTVTNRLKVRPKEHRSDAEIAGRIRAALLAQPVVESFQIGVRVDYGVAKLNGTVDTYYEKSTAGHVAAGVKGVLAIDNNLVVRNTHELFLHNPYVDPYWYPHDYTRQQYVPPYPWKSDLEIKEEIEDELWWSPFVDEGDVTVTVLDGKATLTGVVDSWNEYWAVEANAFDGGATSVTNKLLVEVN